MKQRIITLRSFFVLCLGIIGIVMGSMSLPTVAYAAATTYYISSDPADNPSDTNTGTSASTPWATIAPVNTRLAAGSAGDKFLFKRGGTYVGGIVVKTSGTAASPIVFDAYGTGAKPVITGFSTISSASWTSIGTNLWQTSAPVGADQTSPFVINSALTPLGRYPKATATNGGYISFASGTNTSITDTALASLPSLTGAELVVRPRHWIFQRGTITGHSGSTITFAAFPNAGGYPIKAGGQGVFFQNLPVSLLTQNGEWSYTASTGKLQMYYSGTPTTANIGVVDYLINLNAKNYITISNLSLQGAKRAAVYGVSSANITVSSNDISYAGEYAVSLSYNNNYTVTNNTIVNSLNNAIFLNGSTYTGYTVTGNTIANTGIYAGTLQPLATKNSNHAIEVIVTGATHDAGNAFTTTISNNTITNTGQVPIRFFGNDILIKNNVIDTFLTQLDDNGAIYTYNGTGATTQGVVPKTLYNQRIEGNIIGNAIGNKYGTESGVTQANGIYLDNNANHVDIIGNTTFNIANDATHHNSPQYVTMKDNVFYNAETTYSINHWADDGYNNTNGGQDIIGIDYNNNVSFNTSPTALTYEYVDLATNYPTVMTVQQRLMSMKSTDTVGHPDAMNKNVFHTANSADNFVQWRNCVTCSLITDAKRTLTQWKTLTGFESVSREIPTTASSNVLFLYNALSSSAVKTFSGTYTDVKTNTNYTGSITLQPFSSVVLIKAVGDTVAPTVAITAPSASATVSGVTTITATATDTVGVSGVDFYQGTTLIGTDTTAPYSMSWNTATVVNGVYTLKAVARDAAGNSGTSANVSITVSNAASGVSVSITSPASGLTVSGTIALTATTSGGTVTRVDFYKDTDTAPFATTTSLFTTFFNTATLSNGTHTFKAIGTTSNGLTTISPIIQVTVSNSSTTTTAPSTSVPGTPTGVVAQAGYGKARLSWVAPQVTGGSIASYTAVVNQTGATLSTTKSPVVFSSLTNGTMYTFSVVAKNSSGVGSAGVSNTVVPVTVFPTSSQVVVSVASTLNVRQTAAGSKIGTVANGVKGTVITSSAGWTQVQFPSITGWVSSSYLFLTQ